MASSELIPAVNGVVSEAKSTCELTLNVVIESACPTEPRSGISATHGLLKPSPESRLRFNRLSVEPSGEAEVCRLLAATAAAPFAARCSCGFFGCPGGKFVFIGRGRSLCGE